ncbi:MAG: PQQ-binding-like beta-propeller repeat protein, partial [Pirellulaceae bacterium]
MMRFTMFAMVSYLCVGPVDEHVRYDKSQPGYGNGDVLKGKEDQLARRILDETNTQGGLVVHLNCGDPSARGLTGALRLDDSFLIQGLDRTADHVQRTREAIRAQDAYGPVSVSQLLEDQLPYTDNLVRLIVVSGESPVPREEIERVLCPGGSVVFLDVDGHIVRKWAKPWPDEMDQWTHFLHDSDNNPVANDARVGPPRRFQWIGAPLWSRSHEHAPSHVGGITAGGRIFYMEDEGPRGVIDKRIPEKWSLVARDAFGGKLLWKRPVPTWMKGFHYWLRYPVENNRRMVTSGDRVYLCAGPEQPVLALDAATGETDAEYHDAASSTQLLLRNRVLLCCGTRLVAIDTEAGTTLWDYPVRLAGLNVVCDDDTVVFTDQIDLIGLDLKTGKVLWKQPLGEFLKSSGKDREGRVSRTKSSSLTLHKNHLYVSLNSRGSDYDILAFSVLSGEFLWRATEPRKGRPLYFVSPRELFITDEAVWASVTGVGLDPLTGETKATLRVDQTEGHHQRCHMRKATSRFIIGGKRGLEFIAYDPGTPTIQHDWIRGTCRLGIIPANGMIYLPPEACFCYPGVLVKGFKALVAEAAVSAPKLLPSEARLERGPAYGSTPRSGLPSPGSGLQPSDNWPMYRRDARRSGFQSGEVSRKLAEHWRVALGGAITQPVIADHRVYVAQKDQHTLHALDEETGQPLWTFVAGGRVDSPPTWYAGALYFGCRDGRVYCLRASDGVPAWTYHAAPARRWIGAFDQIESAWPVSGSVVVKDGRVYCAAGRSTFLDGGISLHALDAATGEPVVSRIIHTEQGRKNKDAFHTHHISEGGNADLLVWDGDTFHMGRFQFDSELKPVPVQETEPYGQAPTGLHLASSSGLLDASEHNRSHWTYWRSWPGAHYSTYAPKSGQILAFDDKITYSVKTFDFLTLNQGGKPPLNAKGDLAATEHLPASLNWLSRSPTHHPGGSVCLFADTNDNEPKTPDNFRELGGGFSRVGQPLWARTIPIRARALVLTPTTAFIAGPPHEIDLEDPHAIYENRAGGTLAIYSRTDGKTAEEIKLDDPPTFDGLSAAHGRIFMSDTAGNVVCWRKA